MAGSTDGLLAAVQAGLSGPTSFDDPPADAPPSTPPDGEQPPGEFDGLPPAPGPDDFPSSLLDRLGDIDEQSGVPVAPASDGDTNFLDPNAPLTPVDDGVNPSTPPVDPNAPVVSPGPSIDTVLGKLAGRDLSAVEKQGIINLVSDAYKDDATIARVNEALYTQPTPEAPVTKETIAEVVRQMAETQPVAQPGVPMVQPGAATPPATGPYGYQPVDPDVASLISPVIAQQLGPVSQQLTDMRQLFEQQQADNLARAQVEQQQKLATYQQGLSTGTDQFRTSHTEISDDDFSLLQTVAHTQGAFGQFLQANPTNPIAAAEAMYEYLYSHDPRFTTQAANALLADEQQRLRADAERQQLAGSLTGGSSAPASPREVEETSFRDRLAAELGRIGGITQPNT